VTTIDVQPSLYFTGASALYTAAIDLFNEVQAKYGSIAACSSMAGSYDEAKTWATAYDAHAAQAIDTATALADTMDKYAKAMRTLGYNHQVADYNATIGSKGPAPTKPADPMPAVTLCDAPPPSSGGPGNGLSDIVHLAEKVGITIPDGDTGKLGTVGDAWIALQSASAVGGLSDEIGRIINSVSLIHSPETDTVIADLKSMQTSAQAVATGFGDLAISCLEHASALQELRNQLEKQLEDLAKEIIKEIGVGLAVTVVTSMVTFGIGAIIEAVRVGELVERAAPPIKALVDLWKARRLKKDEDKAQTLADEYKKMKKLNQRIGQEEKAPTGPAKNLPDIKNPEVPKDANWGVISTRPAGWTDADEAAIKDYTGTGHRELNEALRSDKPLAPDQQARVDAINNALGKCPTHPGWVVRGTKLPPEILSKYKEGDTVIEKGLTSSSRTADGAFTGGNNNVEMHIFSKTGKDVSNISHAGQHEEEVLFGNNTPMKVLQNRPGPDGKTILVLQEQ